MPRRLVENRAFAFIANALGLTSQEQIAHIQTDEAFVAYDPTPAIQRQLVTHWIFGLGNTAPANASTEFIVNPFDISDWTGVHRDGVRQTPGAAGAVVDNDHDFYLTGAGFFKEGANGTFGVVALYIDGEPDVLAQVVRMGLARWEDDEFDVAWSNTAPAFQVPLPFFMPSAPYANVGSDVFDLTLMVFNSHATEGMNFDFWLTGLSAPPGILPLYGGGG